MYQEGLCGTINVNLNVPSTKIMGAAALVMDDYAPIIEDALKEARMELHKDTLFQEMIKENIKIKVKHTVEENIRKAVDEVLHKAFWDKFDDIRTHIYKTLLDDVEHIRKNT